jgi:hypothetical protein
LISAPARIRPWADGRSPPAPDPLPKKFGWLLKLERDAVVHRTHLERLLRDAEIAALMAAAPASMGRELRSLCHVLGVTPPPADAPEWVRTMPRTPWTLWRICGRRGPV